MMDIKALSEIEKKVLWLACWTIHNANSLREKDDIKVGGHQASSASMVSIMTALYFSVLRPEDRVAVKPHAAPVFHAIQYLVGNQTLGNLANFRGYGGAQSYPSRTKDVDDVDFSTGSVGLGGAITAFAALVQDYVHAKNWGAAPAKGRMISLLGDAELDEGNIYECLQEGWKQGLRNTWWVIDYNRQSLDGVVHEGLQKRIAGIFEAFGWEVVTLKHGAIQRAAFSEPGGDALRAWINACPNALYSALTYQGGAAWRARLMDEIGDQDSVTDLLDRRSNTELKQLMENLGGHCLDTLMEGFNAIDHNRPTVFIAYTVKGWGTPLAGHKDNHAGLMTAQQMDTLRESMAIRQGHEWDPFEGLQIDVETLKAELAEVPFFARGTRRYAAAKIATPAIESPSDAVISTQTAFGKILDGLANDPTDLADRIITTSPDVTVSTNLGPWVNRRGLFALDEIADTYRVEQVPSTQKWRFSPDGQHIELGIAEMNLFLLLGAAGLSHSLFGERLFPIGTLYDPFISRGLDALNYACYQDARFILAATPSGVSLASEGGAHQSIASPLIGMSQDGLASFEPAFADELTVIMEWAFDYMQRDGKGDLNEHTWLRDETGGAVYLRLSTRPLEQPRRQITPELAEEIVAGGYWLRKPGPNCEVVLAYQGVVASEAITAAGMIGNDRRDIAVLALTSADRMNAGWQAAQRVRARGAPNACSHVERLLKGIPRHATFVTIIDGHPATLGWLGGVYGHRTVSLGVEHFGQTGRVADLYRHFGIDAASIVAIVQGLTEGGPVRLASG